MQSIKLRNIIGKFLKNSTNQYNYQTPTSTEELIKKQETIWFRFTVGLGLMLLFLVLANFGQSMSQLISPLALQAYNMVTGNSVSTNQQFSFIPGWNLDTVSDTNFSGRTLAYFDLPVDPDGSLNTDNDGYQNFKSDSFTSFLQKAHTDNAKVVLTLSQTNNTMIEAILSDTSAQDRLIGEVSNEIVNSGVDGIAIDFEYTGNPGDEYRDDFTSFVKTFTKELHKSVPNALVTVAVKDNAVTGSLYDTKELAKSVDKIYMTAYDFAVPETTNGQVSAPTYGMNASLYLKKIASILVTFLQQVPAQKLAYETAWYGNGNNYPLHESMAITRPQTLGNTMKTPLDKATIEKLTANLSPDAKTAAQKNLPYIANALKDEGILTPNVLAYALATVQHETAGTFEPIEEIKGRKSARRLGYEGGTDYFGRGFIQITHLRNYRKFGEAIGMGNKLVENPDLASTPDVAAKVLAAFFRENNVSNLAENGDFIDARRPINPDLNGAEIADLALQFLYAIS